MTVVAYEKMSLRMRKRLRHYRNRMKKRREGKKKPTIPERNGVVATAPIANGSNGAAVTANGKAAKKQPTEHPRPMKTWHYNSPVQRRF